MWKSQVRLLETFVTGKVKRFSHRDRKNLCLAGWWSWHLAFGLYINTSKYMKIFQKRGMVSCICLTVSPVSVNLIGCISQASDWKCHFCSRWHLLNCGRACLYQIWEMTNPDEVRGCLAWPSGLNTHVAVKEEPTCALSKCILYILHPLFATHLPYKCFPWHCSVLLEIHRHGDILAIELCWSVVFVCVYYT